MNGKPFTPNFSNGVCPHNTYLFSSLLHSFIHFKIIFFFSPLLVFSILRWASNKGSRNKTNIVKALPQIHFYYSFVIALNLFCDLSGICLLVFIRCAVTHEAELLRIPKIISYKSPVISHLEAVSQSLWLNSFNYVYIMYCVKRMLSVKF